MENCRLDILENLALFMKWLKFILFSFQYIFGILGHRGFSTLYLFGNITILIWASLMGLMYTKRASSVLNYNPGTFDNWLNCVFFLYLNLDFRYNFFLLLLRFCWKFIACMIVFFQSLNMQISTLFQIKRNKKTS